MNTVTLRNVKESDLSLFFEYQKEPDAHHMAAFTMKDPQNREHFMAHWKKLMANEDIIKLTILSGEQVVGHILSFKQFGEREVSYWIGQKYWGKGFATMALQKFLDLVTIRPLYARAAKDNIGSIKILEKCGFTISGEDSGFANARGEEIEEFIFILSD